MVSFIIICYVPPVVCDIDSDFNRRGLELMNGGKYQEAAVYFESAYAANPDDRNIQKNLSVVYHYLAIKHASENDWQGAIQNERQSLKYDADNEAIKQQLSLFYNNYALQYAAKGRYDLAQDYLEEALKYTPGAITIKTNLYNITLEAADLSYKNENDFKAKKLCRQAASIMPDKPAAYIFLGNIYYQEDDFENALGYWNKAVAIEPANSALASRIDKLKKEKKVESTFETQRRQHFKIRFDENLDSEYVWAISEILEDARRNIRSDYGLSADEIIPVIVYTQEQFKSATSMPYWIEGLYDGKIRLKKQDISRNDALLKRVLYHEYAHAVLYLSYGNNIPLWLHEGFAQINEPEQALTVTDKRFLSSYMEKSGAFSLESLEAMFSQKENQEAIRAAYLESRLFVEYLIEEYRVYNLKRLLARLKEGKRWQAALAEVYHENIEHLDKRFAEHLDKSLIT